MAYFVPSTPPMRGRAYSFTQPSYGYPGTPYSVRPITFPHQLLGGGAAATVGLVTVIPTTVLTMAIIPATAVPIAPPATDTTVPALIISPRHQTGVTYVRSAAHHSPTLGERILNFFGLGSNRYTDQYGHPVDSRGRPKYKNGIRV
ncbi:hypothetical protein BJV74DRAFT_793692 [Russula compacta]|nr:hypothetical protein BJV74DRAFT_793692 [Russula compacta]